MSLSKHQHTGPGEIIRFKRRKQKRNPRRLLEAVQGDWDRWDIAAKAAGLNWSEFTRRALNAYALAHAASSFATSGALELSEKRPPKTAPKHAAKPRARAAGRKG